MARKVTQAVLITGALGGLGQAFAAGFKQAGWFVIGTGLTADSASACDIFLPCDLSKVAADTAERDRFIQAVLMALPTGIDLHCLINNAAIQRLSGLGDITLADWEDSFRVNVTAPMVLAQGLLPTLADAKGCVINIGSVHDQATKQEFVTYATTKAAIGGLTRAMAVDLKGQVRVVCLAPAATATPMLLAGFEGEPEAFEALAEAHPSQRIAQPSEIADLALFLASDQAGFVNGTTIYADGGVLSRLHDPL